ncbi:RNA polymerase sigma factor CnrH [Caulifigura coniformis]|uniref:RNA polymerase sigma factor CnrH n=1 Tax=Caulifigura coniformis TaxID=2527983 RepID=A0A517SIM4_9PLAN|nr:sigma-70 family RNA polymerase sigma factor [Caulifigura coniformis]QDT55994.1 RNA polymerase sigma factor CnrH [Caulifigura coniformis]
MPAPFSRPRSKAQDVEPDGVSRLKVYEQLIAENRRPLLHYIYSLVLNEADAEDLVQRTSLVMWKKFDEFDQSRSFLAWANGIAFLEVQNFRRTAAAGRLRFSNEVVQGIADRYSEKLQSEEKNRTAALKACLEQVSERDRQLVQAVYWDGTEYEVAARACGMALQTAYNRMRILRVKLLECVNRRVQTESVNE